ncbi:MAG: hypothetical protein N2749_07295 [Clostridia bacterium]|nr:hypothetical protein [Clostridia bacterium]
MNYAEVQICGANVLKILERNISKKVLYLENLSDDDLKEIYELLKDCNETIFKKIKCAFDCDDAVFLYEFSSYLNKRYKNKEMRKLRDIAKVFKNFISDIMCCAICECMLSVLEETILIKEEKNVGTNKGKKLIV